MDQNDHGDVPGGHVCGLERDQERKTPGEKSKKNGGGQFDVSALFSALDSERITRNLNWKEVSAESGVSASALTRLSQGRRPGVDNLAALTTWLGIPADRFMASRARTSGTVSTLNSNFDNHSRRQEFEPRCGRGSRRINQGNLCAIGS